MVPDQFSHLLEEIHKLETELGHLPQKWKVLWDKLELPNTDSLAVSYRNYRGYRCHGKAYANCYLILIIVEFHTGLASSFSSAARVLQHGASTIPRSIDSQTLHLGIAVTRQTRWWKHHRERRLRVRASAQVSDRDPRL